MYGDSVGGGDSRLGQSTVLYLSALAVGFGTLALVGIYWFQRRLDLRKMADEGEKSGRKAEKNREQKVENGPPITLRNPDEKYALELIEKHHVSHDTRRFVFALPSEEHILGLPVGQHIYMSAKINDKLVVRPYTPVSGDNERGRVTFIVKVYFRGKHPKFQEGGKMSQHLDGLSIGDAIDVRGPNGPIIYKGMGIFDIRPSKKDEPLQYSFEHIGLIAGGTGITPMLQLINNILKNEQDPTKIALLYANQSEADILIRDELDRMQAEYPQQFQVWYTVDRASQTWPYSVGFISAEMIKQHLPTVSQDNSAIFMCGPAPMINFACVPSLEELGYPSQKQFLF